MRRPPLHYLPRWLALLTLPALQACTTPCPMVDTLTIRPQGPLQSFELHDTDPRWTRLLVPDVLAIDVIECFSDGTICLMIAPAPGSVAMLARREVTLRRAGEAASTLPLPRQEIVRECASHDYRALQCGAQYPAAEGLDRGDVAGIERTLVASGSFKDYRFEKWRFSWEAPARFVGGDVGYQGLRWGMLSKYSRWRVYPLQVVNAARASRFDVDTILELPPIDVGGKRYTFGQLRIRTVPMLSCRAAV